MLLPAVSDHMNVIGVGCTMSAAAGIPRGPSLRAARRRRTDRPREAPSRPWTRATRRRSRYWSPRSAAWPWAAARRWTTTSPGKARRGTYCTGWGEPCRDRGRRRLPRLRNSRRRPSRRRPPRPSRSPCWNSSRNPGDGSRAPRIRADSPATGNSSSPKGSGL